MSFTGHSLTFHAPTPITDLFPNDWIKKDDPEKLIALVLIILTALVLGLIWSAGPTRRAAEWLESRSLDHVPLYRICEGDPAQPGGTGAGYAG